MNPTSESQSTSDSNNWLGITEKVAVVSSVGAAIAAVASQQFAGLAALPLSISLAISLAQRNRLMTQMKEDYLTRVEYFSQVRQADLKEIAVLKSQAESFGTHLVDITQNVTQSETLSAVNAQRLKSLTEIVEAHSIAQRETAAKLLHLQKATSKPDEFYYEEGVNHQTAGHPEEAVASFNLAIKANESMAEAYYQRGLAQAELGQRQLAIADLRVAASIFFEQGKLEQYQKAKDLSKNVHEALAAKDAQTQVSAQPKAFDAVNVEHFFN